MLDPTRNGEAITTPSEEEQEAITGGSQLPPGDDRSDLDIDPGRLHVHQKPKFDPGGPPQLRR